MQIPKNLPEIIHTNYLSNKKPDLDRNIYIPPAHRFSYCELEFPATVIAWENDLVELKTKSRLANYGPFVLLAKTVVRMESMEKLST